MSVLDVASTRHVGPLIWPMSVLARGAMKRRRVMTGVVTEEWTRHLGMFLDDLYDSVPGLGMHLYSALCYSEATAAVIGCVKGV